MFDNVRKTKFWDIHIHTILHVHIQWYNFLFNIICQLRKKEMHIFCFACPNWSVLQFLLVFVGDVTTQFYFKKIQLWITEKKQPVSGCSIETSNINRTVFLYVKHISYEIIWDTSVCQTFFHNLHNCLAVQPL